MAEVICNEILFFIHNNFGKIPANNLVTVVSGFYEESEICRAKAALHAVCDNLLPGDPDIPRPKMRCAGDSKRRLDAEDLTGLFTCLNAKKIELPVFDAVKASRLPSVRPADADVCSLALCGRQLMCVL